MKSLSQTTLDGQTILEGGKNREGSVPNGYIAATSLSKLAVE